jgi:hypothetical protein
MIDADPEELSLVRPCELWGVSRSAWYSPSRPLARKTLSGGASIPQDPVLGQP